MASVPDVDDTAGDLWLPVRKARAHELVIEVIEDRILSGALKVGDALPPERELAASLEVSRAGVREAVRVLESQGVLRSQPGAGAAAEQPLLEGSDVRAQRRQRAEPGDDDGRAGRCCHWPALAM